MLCCCTRNPLLTHREQLAGTCFRDVSPYASGQRCVVTGAITATRFSGGTGLLGPLAARRDRSEVSGVWHRKLAMTSTLGGCQV